MTSSVKNTLSSESFEIGDAVRLRKRRDTNIENPISRKSVGFISDILVGADDGKLGYVVMFHKENEVPTLFAEEMYKLPPKASKKKTEPTVTSPPKLPEDLK